MNRPPSIPRYNQPIPHMRARASSSLRLGWLTLLLAAVFLPPSLQASTLADTARQLAHKIAAAAGPGAFALEVTNRSSLDDKSVREVRNALEAQLHAEGIHNATADQAMGTVQVLLSESVRDYVWTAEVVIGPDEKMIALVSFPRSLGGAQFAPALPIALKSTLLFTQEQMTLDAALVEMPGGSRLLVLTDRTVAIYRHAGANPAARWELEASLPVSHTRTFPRDLRGRILLRRDHLFDVYLPGAFCHSTSNASAALTLACTDTDDPWPLTADDGGVRAFFAASRNFFTGALSPSIGKISNVTSFYSVAPLPRSGYSLWAFAGVDGSLHLVDGVTDQIIGGAKWGSDLAAVRSSCGVGTQLLASDAGDSKHDSLRAFEVPDRDPVAVSSSVDFEGRILALWPETSGNDAIAIVRNADTGWYETYRVSISCGN